MSQVICNIPINKKVVVGGLIYPATCARMSMKSDNFA